MCDRDGRPAGMRDVFVSEFLRWFTEVGKEKLKKMKIIVEQKYRSVL